MENAAPLPAEAHGLEVPAYWNLPPSTSKRLDYDQAPRIARQVHFSTGRLMAAVTRHLTVAWRWSAFIGSFGWMIRAQNYKISLKWKRNSKFLGLRGVQKVGHAAESCGQSLCTMKCLLLPWPASKWPKQTGNIYVTTAALGFICSLLRALLWRWYAFQNFHSWPLIGGTQGQRDNTSSRQLPTTAAAALGLLHCGCFLYGERKDQN